VQETVKEGVVQRLLVIIEAFFAKIAQETVTNDP
jgi:hypothetical protein